MALREDRMTWLGSMVRVMVQVHTAHLLVIWTKSDTVFPSHPELDPLKRSNFDQHMWGNPAGHVCLDLSQYVT